MKKRLLLGIIFLICVFTSITLYLILQYLDPYENKAVALFSIIFTSLASISTFCTLILYFIKKVYYRWKVYSYHVLTSFRQSFWFALFCLGMLFFYVFGAGTFLTGFFLAALFVLLELFIQNLEN